MPITADPERSDEAALLILAALGAHLDNDEALTDAEPPPYTGDECFVGAVKVLAALVTYAGLTPDDLVEVGGVFAALSGTNTTEESNDGN